MLIVKFLLCAQLNYKLFRQAAPCLQKYARETVSWSVVYNLVGIRVKFKGNGEITLPSRHRIRNSNPGGLRSNRRNRETSPELERERQLC